MFIALDYPTFDKLFLFLLSRNRTTYFILIQDTFKSMYNFAQSGVKKLHKYRFLLERQYEVLLYGLWCSRFETLSDWLILGHHSPVIPTGSFKMFVRIRHFRNFNSLFVLLFGFVFCSFARGKWRRQSERFSQYDSATGWTDWTSFELSQSTRGIRTGIVNCRTFILFIMVQ